MYFEFDMWYVLVFSNMPRIFSSSVHWGNPNTRNTLTKANTELYKFWRAQSRIELLLAPTQPLVGVNLVSGQWNFLVSFWISSDLTPLMSFGRQFHSLGARTASEFSSRGIDLAGIPRGRAGTVAIVPILMGLYLCPQRRDQCHYWSGCWESSRCGLLCNALSSSGVTVTGGTLLL